MSGSVPAQKAALSLMGLSGGGDVVVCVCHGAGRQRMACALFLNDRLLSREESCEKKAKHSRLRGEDPDRAVCSVLPPRRGFARLVRRRARPALSGVLLLGFALLGVTAQLACPGAGSVSNCATLVKSGEWVAACSFLPRAGAAGLLHTY